MNTVLNVDRWLLVLDDDDLVIRLVVNTFKGPARNTSDERLRILLSSPRCLDRRSVDFFIGIIASKARFASLPPAASASVRTRRVIC